MSLENAKSMMEICCKKCREKAIRACLTENQRTIYDAVKAAGGGRNVAEISRKARVSRDVAAVQLGRMLKWGLLERQKTKLDIRFSFYKVTEVT